MPEVRRIYYMFSCSKYGQIKISITGLDKQNFQRKNVNIFLPISFNICFGCPKEPSH